MNDERNEVEECVGGISDEVLDRHITEHREYMNRTTRRTPLIMTWIILGLILAGLVILFTVPGSSQEPAESPTSAVGTIATPNPESRPINETTALKLENLQLRFQLAIQQQQAANQAVVEGRAAIQAAVEALWTELKIDVKDRGNWNVDLNGRKVTKRTVAKE